MNSIFDLKGIKLVWKYWVRAELQTAFLIMLVWRYWIKAELHPQLISTKTQWILLTDGNITIFHLIPAEGMSSTSCRYLQAFSSCIDFASNMEECCLSRSYILQRYILAWHQNRESFNSPRAARKLGCKTDYNLRDLKVTESY